jgi:hypothetical protein
LSEAKPDTAWDSIDGFRCAQPILHIRAALAVDAGRLLDNKADGDYDGDAALAT